MTTETKSAQTDSAQNNRIGKFLLEAIVFFSGALVMIYEVVGSRILAPHIGTSTYVWTSLIGVILASLSVGYWFGGRAADRNPSAQVLAGVLFAAGALISLTILLQGFVLSTVADLPVGLEIKSIAAALILFAPASVFLGFVPPFAVKLRLATVESAGKTVGRLYALSTLGSIVGTFVAGFVLLPSVGSTRTLYFLAAALLAMSLALAPFRLTQTNLFVFLLFFCAVGYHELNAYARFQTHELRDFDTEYNRVRVFRIADSKTNKTIVAMTTDPISTQSAINRDDDELVLNYTRYYHLLRFYKPDFENSLMLGGAGYSFPKDYLRRYPERKIDVVEIDPQMTAAARSWFRLHDNPNLRIFHEDGRVFLNRAAPARYDAVLLDVFGSLYSVPFQMTTHEAVEKMHSVLKPDGVVILNLISALEGDGALFLQAEYRTFAEIFPRVELFRVAPEKPETASQNVILVACKSVCGERAAPDEEIAGLLKNKFDKSLNLTVPVLTDDYAPVEYYTSLAQKAAR